MPETCDPSGRCPQCGYENGPGVARCVRCRKSLTVVQGCSGSCSKCHMQADEKKQK